jgi:hypothetical protein
MFQKADQIEKNILTNLSGFAKRHVAEMTRKWKELSRILVKWFLSINKS